MSNDYFTETGDPVTLNRGSSALIRNVFTLIRQGFDKLPSLTTLFGGKAAYAADSGSANAYAITVNAAIIAYADGQQFTFKAANANTTASTLNVNSIGAIALRRGDDSALVANDIVAGQIVTAAYNTTTERFQLMNMGASASASATSAAAAASSASSASTQASNAAASAAAAAIYAAGLNDTSSTSLAIAIASKTFTCTAGKQFAAGQFISAVSAANNANFMHGQVTSYSGTTLIINVTDIGGTGTKTDWLLSVSGSQGPAGAAGAAGSVPIAAGGGSVDAITATYSPALTLSDQVTCYLVCAGANTTTTPTFAPNGLTAHTIVARGGSALAAGDIPGAGFVANLEYNLANTVWELLNPRSASLGLANNFSAAQRAVPSVLTDAATVAVNAALSNAYSLTLGGNRTLGVPTNAVAGHIYSIDVRQDSTGSRTLAYTWPYVYAGSTAPALSTPGCSKDQLVFETIRSSTSTVTITIAAPGVVSWTAHGLENGDIIQLTTTGALPTGLTASTTYFVAGKTTNDFKLSTTLANSAAGTYITTSGSQSGTHTMVAMTIRVSLNKAWGS